MFFLGLMLYIFWWIYAFRLVVQRLFFSLKFIVGTLSRSSCISTFWALVNDRSINGDFVRIVWWPLLSPFCFYNFMYVMGTLELTNIGIIYIEHCGILSVHISLHSARSTLPHKGGQTFPFNYFTYSIEISMFLIFHGFKLLPRSNAKTNPCFTQQTINTKSVNTQQL